jgi:SAM-dependent methyltransferase
MSLNYVAEYNRKIRGWLGKVFAVAASIDKTQLERRPCPVCGDTHSVWFANNDYLDYERCGNCALVYMNPAPSAAAIDQGFQGQDELLMEYFGIIREYKTGLPERPDPAQDGKLKDVYAEKKSGKLLDVGCSVGDFLHKAKYFYEVEGLEVNPHTAAIAEQYFTIHKRFLAELDLKPEYDVVTLHQILYGVPDPVGLLRDIHRVLKDDGVLYINTPNADSHAMKLFGGKTNHLYGYTTQNVFNFESLEKLAGLTGFRIKSFRTEWLDVYVTDLVEFREHPEQFVHKRNTQVENYEENIRLEDELHASLKLPLGKHGNYIVAVLEKTATSRRS